MPTAGEFIARARDCQLANQWNCVADNYLQVIASYPDSADAATVLLPLAYAELTHLNDAASALAHFERYLSARAGGTLANEAWLGKARALRLLGRGTDEAAALRALLTLDPRGPYAAQARARLDELATPARAVP